MKTDICSCIVKPPARDWAHAGAWGWALYVDEWFWDSTQFDPQCPYHGDQGTMVAHLPSDRQQGRHR
jgi:hypothetical protein